MKKLIIANWKCNPDSPGRAVALVKKINQTAASKNVEVVICPPFVYLESLSKVLKAKTSNLKPSLGAQDVFWEDVGPYTGEVSWHQLKHLRVEYVVIGHSERRRLLKETDEMINKKVLAALNAGLKVILCVGEPLVARKKSLAAAKKFVKDQLTKDLKGTSNLQPPTSNLIIAYEPLWAISTSGTHQIDTPEDAALMARFIKSQESGVRGQVRVIYGGSVNSKNIGKFLQYKEINGALVGGASLKAEEFKKIIKITSNG